MTEIRTPKWADAAHTVIDVEMNHATLGWVSFSAMASDEGLGADIFARAELGEFGAIAAYVAPPFNADMVRREYSRRFNDALQGKESSLLSYGLRLQYESSTRALTDDEHADFGKLGAIDLWQTAMIDTRESLIAAQDITTYALDATWPAAPDGLAAFLTGF